MTRFRRLLVPHDLSAHADDALEVASRIAGPEGAILVLHAVPPVMPPPELAAVTFLVPVGEMVADARRHLERVVGRRIGPRGPKTTIRVVVGDAHRSIIHHARGRDAIVMSTRGRTGLAHLVIGSVAEKVVRHSEIPVLTLAPRAARRMVRARAAGTRRRAARTSRTAGAAVQGSTATLRTPPRRSPKSA
jgi:nucleotide-binding universal stress UspA family protein